MYEALYNSDTNSHVIDCSYNNKKKTCNDMLASLHASTIIFSPFDTHKSVAFLCLAV